MLDLFCLKFLYIFKALGSLQSGKMWKSETAVRRKIPLGKRMIRHPGDENIDMEKHPFFRLGHPTERKS